ncbi:MAG: DoxX family membrane protein [Candidatus Cybelea sp.]
MSEPRMRMVRLAALGMLALFFIAAGINHLVHPDVYVRIVPPSLPAPALLVQISGICEILGGIGVLVPNARRFSGVGLIALLLAVFPANVHMAQHPELYADIASAAVFYIRLPLQFVLIAWVWWICIL